MFIFCFILQFLNEFYYSTYSRISERGLAQWRMEQAGVMIELLGDDDSSLKYDSVSKDSKAIVSAFSDTADNYWAQRIIFIRRDPYAKESDVDGKNSLTEMKNVMSQLIDEVKSLHQTINQLKK